MKYVKIQSTKTIRVTAGLQFTNNTNVNANTSDKLKIAPEWQKLSFLITKGAPQWYPKFITEWNTVKVLVEKGIITISTEERDDIEDEKTKEKSIKLENDKKAFEKKTKAPSKKEVSLNDLGE